MNEADDSEIGEIVPTSTPGAKERDLRRFAMLQSRETLREEVGKGFASLDAGAGISAEQAYARAEQRIAEIEQGER